MLTRAAHAVVVAIALMALRPPAAQATVSQCPDAFFVGVRGSGDSDERNRGMGPSVEPVFEAVRAALPDRVVEPSGLAYPAVDTVRASFAIPGAPPYRSSVDEGAARLERDLGDLLNRCPVTPVVVAGHSQGAHVIDKVLAADDGKGYPNLVGAVLLGDPTRYPSRPYNVAPNPTGPGLFHARWFGPVLDGSTPTPGYWGRVDSYCVPGDPICSGGPRQEIDVRNVGRLPQMFATTTHSDYARTGVSAQAGTRLAERLRTAFDATRPADGTFGPTIFNDTLAATGIARTPTGQGYWHVSNGGDVSTFGDAGAAGSMGGQPLNAQVVGIAATPTGGGYWLVGADGGVFAFGDALFAGSMAGQPLNAAVVGIAATPSGGGYWLVGADGGVFAFGDAPFAGSLADRPRNAGVVGIAPTVSGGGYWLVAADGGVFTFGDAPFLGSAVDRSPTSAVVGVAATPDGAGYWLIASDGAVYGVGDAPLYED